MNDQSILRDAGAGLLVAIGGLATIVVGFTTPLWIMQALHPTGWSAPFVITGLWIVVSCLAGAILGGLWRLVDKKEQS